MFFTINPKATLFLLLSLATIVLSCGRHGAEDPLISLGDRDKLIRGEWELEEYYFNENTARQVTTNFNFRVCDSAAVAGTRIFNLFQQETLKDTVISCTVVNTLGDENLSNAYDITMFYNLKIERDGTYSCSGRYVYYDTYRNANTIGNFAVSGNSWYWEDSKKEKWSLTFNNFPFLDSNYIAEAGSPIRTKEKQTFDVLRLAPKEMWLDFQTYEDESYVQEFDPFTVGTQTNCTSKVQVNEDIDRDVQYRFVPYTGEDEI